MKKEKPKIPKIPNLVDSADYSVFLLDPVSDLEKRVSKIMAAESLPRERRGKPYDLRTLIEDLSVVSNHDGAPRLEMRLVTRTGATGRPEEALLALGVDPFAARVHRKTLNLRAI